MRIEIDAVTVARGGRDVVREASLEIAPGTVLGLVGPNGSGKSTLLRTVYRALVPRAGTVRIDGRDVRRLGQRDAARTVAVMLQDTPTDFDLSVEETVLLGRAPHRATFGRDSPQDLAIVAEAMARTQILELADRMVATLSGGQRQRVMLARALAQRSPVLVLDEPSNHLDISHQHEVMSIVRSLGCTVIAALHDLNLASQYCDEVAVLDAGRVVAGGPPAEVLTPERIRRTFHVEARRWGAPPHSVLSFARLPEPDASHAPPTSMPRSPSPRAA